MKRTTIAETIAILFLILFLYTGISKIMDYPVFKEQIATSPFLRPISKLIAIGVPTVEFLVTILLAVPAWRLKGFYLSAALMSAFTLYIIGIMSLNDQLPCSCGGIISELSWPQHIIVNSVLLLLSLSGVLMQRKVRKEQQQYYTVALS